MLTRRPGRGLLRLLAGQLLELGRLANRLAVDAEAKSEPAERYIQINGYAVSPVAETDLFVPEPHADQGPPAHWLSRADSAGPPAHWLAHIQQYRQVQAVEMVTPVSDGSSDATAETGSQDVPPVSMSLEAEIDADTGAETGARRATEAVFTRPQQAKHAQAAPPDRHEPEHRIPAAQARFPVPERRIPASPGAEPPRGNIDDAKRPARFTNTSPPQPVAEQSRTADAEQVEYPLQTERDMQEPDRLPRFKQDDGIGRSNRQSPVAWPEPREQRAERTPIYPEGQAKSRPDGETIRREPIDATEPVNRSWLVQPPPGVRYERLTLRARPEPNYVTDSRHERRFSQHGAGAQRSEVSAQRRESLDLFGDRKNSAAYHGTPEARYPVEMRPSEAGQAATWDSQPFAQNDAGEWWPDLPVVDLEVSTEREQALREWEHLRRLDQEQRGAG